MLIICWTVVRYWSWTVLIWKLWSHVLYWDFYVDIILILILVLMVLVPRKGWPRSLVGMPGLACSLYLYFLSSFPILFVYFLFCILLRLELAFPGLNFVFLSYCISLLSICMLVWVDICSLLYFASVCFFFVCLLFSIFVLIFCICIFLLCIYNGTCLFCLQCRTLLAWLAKMGFPDSTDIPCILL